MSSVRQPRGPRPARVYWTRRVCVLGTAVLLVVGLARVFAGGSDGGSGGPQAQVVGGSPTTQVAPDLIAAGPSGMGRPAPAPATPTASATTARPDPRRTSTPTPTPTPTPLASPSGPCPVDDLVVTPSTSRPRAGGQIDVTVSLTTRTTPACTFEVSSRSVVLKITSGNDMIWSSQQCPKAVPAQTVVARTDHPGTAVVRWNGQRSDARCSRTTQWALPGYYHAEAAALGGDPVDVQFRLYKPLPPTITPTPTPTATRSASPTRKPTPKH